MIPSYIICEDREIINEKFAYLSTRSGNDTAVARDCIPPIDEPTAA